MLGSVPFYWLSVGILIVHSQDSVKFLEYSIVTFVSTVFFRSLSFDPNEKVVFSSHNKV